MTTRALPRGLGASFCFLSLLACAAAAKEPSVLIKVNGQPIKRSAVADRAWKEYATTVINEMVDELLVAQAQASLGAKPDPNQVEARLRRIRDQFPDDKTFLQKLAAGGGSPGALRAQIESELAREALLVKAKGLSVGEDEARQYFEANKDKFSVPEAVRLRHILLADQKQAEDFLAAVRAGADFPKLAASVSLDAATKEQGGDVGFISRGTLDGELEKTAFGLRPGEVAVIKSARGYHLIKVEELRPAGPTSFDQIKDNLRQAILADKAAKAWPGYLQELRAQARFEGLQPAPR